MKLIEALKKIKELTKKADDIKAKIGAHCADLDYETTLYNDQRSQISEWLQSHSDILKHIGQLDFSIKKTNILTPVTIELNGKSVTKTIAEWILRRKKTALIELSAWQALTDRGLREGQTNVNAGSLTPVTIKIRRYFDPKERDTRIVELKEEPSLIDGKLEIVNAITDLIQ